MFGCLYLLDVVGWRKAQDFAKEVELPIKGILDVLSFAEPVLLSCVAVQTFLINTRTLTMVLYHFKFETESTTYWRIPTKTKPLRDGRTREVKLPHLQT